MNYVMDSLLFMHEVRQSLSTLYDDKIISNFIMNEATDYQCLSLLINKKLPKTKRNIFEETKLLNELKQSVIDDYDNIIKHFSESSITDFLLKVNPLEPKGISTTFNNFGTWNGISENNYWEIVSDIYKRKNLNEAYSFSSSYLKEAKCPKDNLKNFLSKKSKKSKKLTPAATLALASYSKKKSNKRKRTILKELDAKDLFSSNQKIMSKYKKQGALKGLGTGSFVGSLAPGGFMGTAIGTGTGATIGTGIGYLRGKKQGEKAVNQANIVRTAVPAAIAAAGYLAYKHHNNPDNIRKEIAVYKVMISQQCSKTKNPQECKMKCEEKIKKLEARLEKVSKD